jgi:hypothetical protein
MKTVERQLGGRARLTEAKGNAAANRRYCLKDDNIIADKGIPEGEHEPKAKEPYQVETQSNHGGPGLREFSSPTVQESKD